jgi:predicted TIM-barrel fold metal-dependent hydrolase
MSEGHKVLFGSNHPARSTKDCLAGLDPLRLGKKSTDAFLHGNAERVFAIRQTGPPDRTAARPSIGDP